eukprot:2619972-Pyramimonas_sp.AAC.1
MDLAATKLPGEFDERAKDDDGATQGNWSLAVAANCMAVDPRAAKLMRGVSRVDAEGNAREDLDDDPQRGLQWAHI